MSHAKNKVEWCLKKAAKEKGKHRGLVRVVSDMVKARAHIAKAEHNLNLMISLKKGEFSDWCGAAAFYSMYHSLLAILAKFGYESGNQECTFALISSLIEDGKINLDRAILNNLAKSKSGADKETLTDIREEYQYGTRLSMKDNTYEELLGTVKNLLGESKRILEE